MRRLALLTLRSRPSAFAGGFVALLAASALTMACGLLLAAGLAAKQPAERYAAAPVLVTGVQQWPAKTKEDEGGDRLLPERARIDATLAERIAAVPGVRAAIADVAVPVRVFADGAGRSAIPGPGGHAVFLRPWSAAPLTPYSLRAGRAPVTAGEVVLDAGTAARGSVRIGDRVRLLADGPAAESLVVGIAAPHAQVTRQAAVFATDAEAARIAAHPGRVDAIGVLPTASDGDAGALAAAVRRAVGRGVEVHTGDGRGEAEHLDQARLRSDAMALAGVFGGIALMIAVFVVASTLGLALQQREREIALLRAIAATPRQVRRMIAWEALVVGVVASVAGLAPGTAAAAWIGPRLVSHDAAPENLRIAFELVPALVAVAICTATALVAVRAAGRRAARISPTRALQEAAAPVRLLGPLRLLLGLAALGGAIALMVVSATTSDVEHAESTASGVSLVLVLAVALLGPLVAGLAARLAGPWLTRVSPVGGFLASANVRADARRFSTASTALVLCVGVTATMLFVGTTRDHAAQRQGEQRVVADLALTAPQPGLPAAAAAQARTIAGIDAAVGAAATSVGPSFGALGGTFEAQAVEGPGISRVLDLDVRAGALDALPTDGVALSEVLARRQHVRVGERVPVMLGDGARVSLRVVALYHRALGFGDVLLPFSLVAAHRTSPQLDRVLVRTEPGADRAAVAGSLRALATGYPGLRVESRAALATREQEGEEAGRWVGRMLVAVIFLYTAIAVVNTLATIALARRRELSMLRLSGATVRQVVAMARWEAAFVLLLGIGLGVAVALGTLIPFAYVVNGTLVPYAPPQQIALVLGLSALLGGLGCVVPMRLALRARPAETAGVRE